MNCIFRYLPLFLENTDFQLQCDKEDKSLILLLLSTPLVYLIILFLEKNYCKNKYRTL